MPVLEKPRISAAHRTKVSPAAARCRRKFLRAFPGGFRDETYYAWERDYKWAAHARWEESLGRQTFLRLLRAQAYGDIASAAVRVESRTNLLFSFEKMALRDAVKSQAGARLFAEGLYEFLHEPGEPNVKFEQWCDVLDSLPRRQTRVLTWPVVTVFGFIAQPQNHFFFKPTVTRRAAAAYEFGLMYHSRPDWETYGNVLQFAAQVRRDLRDLKPRDMIDIQSFIWVQGSDEYPD